MGRLSKGKTSSLYPTGVPRAYQLKTGDLNLSDWRAIKGEIDELELVEIEMDPARGARKRVRRVGNADVVFLDVAVDDAMLVQLLERRQAGAQQAQEGIGALERVAQRRGIGVARLDAQPYIGCGLCRQ